MESNLRRWYSAFLASVIALAGFESCGSNDDNGNGTNVEKGTPRVTYLIKGHVQDADAKPLEGIKVKYLINNGGMLHPIDSTQTDASGNYVTNRGFAASIQAKDLMVLTFEDIDGEAKGGTFENDSVKGTDFKVKKVDNGDGSWSVGFFELTADKTLKRKAKQ